MAQDGGDRVAAATVTDEGLLAAQQCHGRSQDVHGTTVVVDLVSKPDTWQEVCVAVDLLDRKDHGLSKLELSEIEA